MNRKPNTPDAKDVQCFDKYLVKVNREPGRRAPVTKSVQIMELQRGNMPNMQTTLDALNRSQDHRNPSELGYPMVLWWFPAGKVKSGETYKANDIIMTEIDEETGKEERVTNPDGTYKVIGLNISIDKKIVGEKDGKPIFETAKEA